jgi:ATP-dependent DNA ligase
LLIVFSPHVAAYPAGRVHRAVPSNQTSQLPSGRQWLHEIKHDGFRVIARKDGAKVRLYSRPGNDLTYRFPLIVGSLARLRSRSCIIDGRPSPATRAAHPASSVSVTADTTPACFRTPPT